MDKILDIKNINKEFSGKKVVNDISFEVNKGEIMGVLGPNGAGKTTIIRCIMSILYPDSGSVDFYFGNKKNSIAEKTGYLPEERGLYKTVKVMDILLYLASLKNYPKVKAVKRIHEYLEKFDLKGKENTKIEELSKGMAQKVQFIGAIIHEPEFLILDEPFSGLDPVSQDVFKKEIKDLAENGTAILLSSHQMNLVEALCNRIFLINKGEKVIYGEIDEVKERFADYKCVIKQEGKTSENRLFAENSTFIRRTETDGDTITLYLKKDADPNEFLREIAGKSSFRELYIDRISLHDIFVSIATGGLKNEK